MSATDQNLIAHPLLRRSFVHLAGIGPKSEANLWRQGIADWDTLRGELPRLYKKTHLDSVQRSLEQSEQAWEAGDLYYFHRLMPPNERWRLVAGGFDRVAYFDIEASDGGMPPLAESTAVAFYFRGEVLQEHEHGAKRRLIEYILAEASLLCSYNGGGYDVPFLSREYGITFAKAHVDLCPWLRRQGFKGGLKAIQKAHPQIHQRCSFDIDGYDAVRLWRLHQQGVSGALPTLLTYNAEDAVVLEPLLVEAFNREVEAYPHFGLTKLTAGLPPTLATAIDLKIYQRLRGSGALLAAANNHRVDETASLGGLKYEPLDVL